MPWQRPCPTLAQTAFKECVMRLSFLFLTALVLSLSPALDAQESNSTAADVSGVTARYEESLKPLDAIFEDLGNENLPLKDESGEPIGHRPIENRKQALEDLRQTLEKLRMNPESLKWATTFLIQSESLSDDLYDLSQIAYDNDREELGRRLSEVVGELDAQTDAIENLVFALAGAKEKRIRQLEDENANLHQQLKDAAAKH